MKPHSALLRVIAVILLCTLALTGCLDTGGLPTEPFDENSGYLTSGDPQNGTSANTEAEMTIVHEHSFEDATCTSAKTCSVCGVTEGEPLGHQWNAANCTTSKTCKDCGATDGDPIGHNWKPATCSTPVTCETCGETDGKPVDHNWLNATCSTAATCKYCGKTNGKPLDHDWKDATCTEATVCIVCGKTKGSAAGHQWKAATCTTAKTCKVCDETTGSPAAHKYSKGKCSKCGAKDPSYGESTSSMVWIPTNGGKKYHRRSSCSNMKNPEKVTLSRAKQLGFTACKKCY